MKPTTALGIRSFASEVNGVIKILWIKNIMLGIVHSENSSKLEFYAESGTARRPTHELFPRAACVAGKL